MKHKWIGIVALVFAASSALACSSSDDSSGGGGAAKSSCNDYCDATVAANCADSSDCKSFECDGLDKATGACATAMKTYYDCMKAQTDVCGQTCTLDLAKCQ
jgi:hypothetical protein